MSGLTVSFNYYDLITKQCDSIVIKSQIQQLIGHARTGSLGQIGIDSRQRDCCAFRLIGGTGCHAV